MVYVPGCPNVAATRRRLAQALARTGRAAVVHERPVHSPAEAARFGLRGSPTVLIDGRDPFDGDDLPGLSCRLYPGGGAGGGLPSVDEWCEALGR